MQSKKLTPYSELDSVLSSHAQNIQGALGDNFVGFYLQGSLAIGDFDLTSDVDFTVITNRDLSDEEVAKIQEVHTKTVSQNTRWVKHLEYSFFPLPKFRQHSSSFKNGALDTSEERKLWYFDNGSRTIERSDHDNTLVVRWEVREKGIAVLGPDPKTLIDPVSPDDLRREIKEFLVGWTPERLQDYKSWENRFHQVFFVLNWCRALQDLVEGRITSKKDGVEWAKKNLDPKWFPLIDYSWEQRQDEGISVRQSADPQKWRETLEFVQYVLDKVKEIKS